MIAMEAWVKTNGMALGSVCIPPQSFKVMNNSMQIILTVIIITIILTIARQIIIIITIILTIARCNKNCQNRPALVSSTSPVSAHPHNPSR